MPDARPVDWRAVAARLVDLMNAMYDAVSDVHRKQVHLHEDGTLGAVETALEGDHPDCMECEASRVRCREWQQRHAGVLGLAAAPDSASARLEIVAASSPWDEVFTAEEIREAKRLLEKLRDA